MTNNNQTAGRNGLYTPATINRMKYALQKYAADNAVKSSFYHLLIRETLGLPVEDKRLHESDPRHWFKGHKPNPIKLDLYAQFIERVYPEFQFTEDAK